MSADNTIGENIDCLDAPKVKAIPTILPIKTGITQSIAASCKRQVRICPGVAPMLEKMPNLMDTGIHRYSKRVMDD